MSPDYLNSLENDSADVMQYSDLGSESEHENHEEELLSTPGDVYQSSRRGHLSFHSQPSGRGCQSIERGRNPTSQGSGRGYNSPLIERGRNQMSQPSGRGGSSHFVDRGQNQPSGRGGSSQRGRNQTYQASGRGGNSHPIQHGRNETSQPSEHGDHSRQPIQALDLSTSGPFLRQPPQPPLEHDSQEALGPIKNTSESEALMAVREENLNLKDKIIATRSDLVDEKYQHQMLQVRYAELEKKCNNLGEENTHLRTQLEKNREMQRLFPVFMKNSSTNQILVDCAVKLPDKCTIYTTLIGLLNTKNYNFGGECVEILVNTTNDCLKSCRWSDTRLMLRFMADLVNCHVVLAGSLLQLLDNFVDAALKEGVPPLKSMKLRRNF